MTHQIIQYGIFIPNSRGSFIKEFPLFIAEGVSYEDVLTSLDELFYIDYYSIYGTYANIAQAWNEWSRVGGDLWNFVLKEIGLPNLREIVLPEQEALVLNRCPRRDKDGNLFNIEGAKFLNGRMILPSIHR